MPISSDSGTERAPRLPVAGVSAGYGAVPVVSDVTMEVAIGECVAVVGPNGAGKSTLLKAIVGLLSPSTGTVTVGEHTIAGLRPDVIARKGVGYVPQVRDIFDDLTVRENLEMGGFTLPAREVRGRIDEVLEVFPVLAPLGARPAGRLSGGERKLLAIGRVLMTRPSVLVLDEPTANLSPAMAKLVLQETVPQLAGGGVALLVVEQWAPRRSRFPTARTCWPEVASCSPAPQLRSWRCRTWGTYSWDA